MYTIYLHLTWQRVLRGAIYAINLAQNTHQELTTCYEEPVQGLAVLSCLVQVLTAVTLPMCITAVQQQALLYGSGAQAIYSYTI